MSVYFFNTYFDCFPSDISINKFTLGAVLVGGAVAVINGVVNAEYVNMAAQIGAVVPEAAVSLVGGSGVIAHAVYNARLKKAKKKVEFDIAVDDEVKRRTRRP